MKLQDPLYGISIANGSITFNLLYGIYIVKIILDNDKGVFQYSQMLFWLGLSHIISFLISLAAFFIQLQKHQIMAKTLVVIKNALYQGVFFYVSVQYFKVKDTIDDIEVREWIFLELITYFSQILSVVIFFFVYSYWFQDKNYMFQEQDMNQQDSLVIQKISQYGAEILIIVYFWFKVDNETCGNKSYKDVLLLFFGFNLMLFIGFAVAFRYLQLDKEKQQKRKMRCLRTKCMKIITILYVMALIALYAYLFFRLVTSDICTPMINFWLKGNIYIIPAVLLIALIAICQRNRSCIKNLKKQVDDNLKEEIKSIEISNKNANVSSFSFRDDFFAIVYYGFIYIDDFEKQRETGYILTENVLAKIYFNCILIFTLQMTLVWFAFLSLIQQTEAFIIPDQMSVLLTRFVCAIILHIQIEGDLKQGINMIEFSMNIVKRKKRKVPQILVASMQFVGALLTEIINILLLCSLTEIQDIIINMVAFGVIAQLDDFYANTLKNFRLKELTEQATLSKEQEIKVEEIQMKELSIDEQEKDEDEEQKQEEDKHGEEGQVSLEIQQDQLQVDENYVAPEQEQLLVQQPQNLLVPIVVNPNLYQDELARRELNDSYSNSINAKFEDCADKIIFIFCYNLIYRTVKALYESFYYYFMPFTIVIIALFQNFYKDLFEQ